MKFIDEFRDPKLARKLQEEIVTLAAGRPYKLMEVCGGHTHTIYRHGLHQLLPDNVELVHGPGCPVCVIPMGRLDDAIAIARNERVILATFGDMLRVPAGKGSLLDARAAGADVRVVYSPLDALKLARNNPDREVVFLGVGFETTAPSTALTLIEARNSDARNFSVFCNHVLILPALKAILDSPDMQLQGFIGPGHVSTVIGTAVYDWIPERYQRPVVVSGFEPLDVLQSVLMLVRQLHEGRCEVENQYGRVVREGGNPQALAAIRETMEVRPQFEWRGLGYIPGSAFGLRPEFAAWDAEQRYEVPGHRIADPRACQCGEVLKGVLKPWECRVFGTACTPETPIGTCMVSSEGACAAYYTYGRQTLKTPA